MPSTDESGPAVSTVAVEETQAAEVNDDLIQENLGKYRLIRHLATGGMAEIYLAEQVGSDGFAREVVIKRILPHLAKDKEFVAMFRDEARLAANLNHPNIGQIFGFEEHGKQRFIAMEFIDGASLDELIDKAAPLPIDVVARIIADTLGALDFAHESTDRSGKPLNIVHRDVTPSNIMVSIDGIVKLVDFGVAKAAKKDHKTQTGAVKGKFAYMAPEQIETSEIDRRADIFSVGIVFYEALTGIKPFGEELAAVSRILHEEPRDPTELRPEIPEAFVRIVSRALKKDPAQRYPTAHTMLLDIETALRRANSYVGLRETSYVVRRSRGMPLPEGVELGFADTGLFAADRSGEHEAPAVRSTEDATDGSTGTEGVEAPTAPRRPLADRARELVRSPWFAIAGVFLLGFVLVTFAVVGALREKAPPVVPSSGEPPVIVLNTVPYTEKGADSAALYEPDGEDVLLDSIPTTRLYKGGKLVGTTPFQTRLKPGTHRVELALGDERKTAVVDVEDGAAFQRVLLDFSTLGEAPPPPETKRKGRRASPGERIKRGLRSLF